MEFLINIENQYGNGARHIDSFIVEASDYQEANDKALEEAKNYHGWPTGNPSRAKNYWMYGRWPDSCAVTKIEPLKSLK